MTLYIHVTDKLHVFTVKLKILRLCNQDKRHLCTVQDESKSDRLLVHLPHKHTHTHSQKQTLATTTELKDQIKNNGPFLTFDVCKPLEVEL